MRVGTPAGIRAFFDIYQRQIADEELEYLVDVFAGIGVTASAATSSQSGASEAQMPAPEVSALASTLAPENTSSTLSVSPHQQYRFSVRKWRRATRVARWFSVVPWIKGIAVSNTLAMLCVREESDIDLFILCKRSRVWLARLFVNSVLRLLRLRPGEARSDPVCPTFFVDEVAFDLSRIALPTGDSYLRFWLATLAPVWDRDHAFSDFFSANHWALTRDIVRDLPIRSAYAPCESFAARVARFFLRILDNPVCEFFARAVQMRLLSKRLRAISKTPASDVLLNNHMLKFHDNDRRALLHEQWLRHLSSYESAT